MKDIINKILLTDVIEEFPTYITIYGEDYTILWTNRISRERKGLALEDLDKIKCYELQGRSEPCENCVVTKVIESGQPHTVEALEYEGDSPLKGVSSWYLKAAPLRDRDGTLIGILKVSHNISEHVERKLQYEKNIEFLHDLVENTNDIIWASDSRGVLEYTNHAMERILGYTKEDLVDKPAPEFLHPEDKIKLEEIISSLVKEKRGWNNLTLRWKHKDGSWRYIESTSSPVLDSRGKVISYRGVNRDVTERELLTAQLMQAQKMESVGRLAGGMSHDFNNMLGVILGYLEMSFKQLDPSHPVYEYLKQINEAADRSANLTRQLLAFARKQIIEPKVLDLNSVVEPMLKMIRRLIGTDIQLHWNPGENLWPVEIDPSQVDQILANLCVNARDAIEGVGNITIKTENRVVRKGRFNGLLGMIPGKYVVLTVSDTGCGIDKKIIDDIFEPFFTTKPGSEGTGLGLSTIYGIVKQNNGFVYAFSDPAEDTRFDIYLPRYTGERKLMENNKKTSNALAGNESILLVEDEEAYLKIAKLLLENLGYKVTGKNNSLGAYDCFRKNPDKFDLLITDIVMPELRGRELRDKIKAINPGIKYLFISGHDTECPSGRIRIDENEPFLQKPFTQRELALKVREILDEE